MKYDYIITGAGCAGLSLAFHLAESAMSGKQILLIEKAEKNKNDRTWCFWESEQNPFESIVHHRWDNLYFKSPTLDKKLDISPYQYKMIKGIDFYNFVLQTIEKHPNITIVQEEVTSIEQKSQHAIVRTSTQTYEAEYVFNSIIFDRIDTSNSNYVAQHFGGWVIETSTPQFDPKEATLMDFRIPQEGETRFMYCLPTTSTIALVEATAFSNNILTEEGYGEMIEDYLNNYLNITDYKILHKEIGVIPMTTYNFKKHRKPRIIPIGTMGGDVKPSTGYAFTRIQKHTKAIATALSKGKSPIIQESWFKKRFHFYDNVLLNVMLKKRVPTQRVFSQLFKRNRGADVLSFLNEQTSFIKELFITNAAPILPFTVAAFDEIFKSILPKSNK